MLVIIFIAADEAAASRCQFGTLKRGQNFNHLFHAFTEQGVVVISSATRPGFPPTSSSNSAGTRLRNGGVQGRNLRP
jgi:hypothetical protein